MRRTIGCALALMAFVACRPDAVQLNYEFPEDSTARYMLTAEAESSWDIGGPGSGSYRVTFEVEETVQSISDDEAVVEVSMTPVDIEENGLPSPGAQARAFTLRVARSGEVLEVIEVDGVAASGLEPDQIIFIGTYRPPLPEEPAHLDEEWTADPSVGASVFQQILTRGRLQGLNEDPEGRRAEIEYEGQSSLVWTAELPQGSAELTGSASTQASATFDIDGGYLRAAESTTSGDFDVRVVAEQDQVPINGSLHLDLTLTVERLN